MARMLSMEVGSTWRGLLLFRHTLHLPRLYFGALEYCSIVDREEAQVLDYQTPFLCGKILGLLQGFGCHSCVLFFMLGSFQGFLPQGFVWASSNSNHGFHRVTWDYCCLPKDSGCLALMSTQR